MNILMILTSHNELGNTGRKTGFWIEEFAAPYYLLKEAGVNITIASPKGGQPPVDPKSDEDINQTPATIRYKADVELPEIMANTKKLSDVSADDFDGVFFPGGHGPLWDLAIDADSIQLIKSFRSSKKPIVAVCHAPAVLLNVTNENGESILKDKQVTGFSNTEEEAVQLSEIVPFLLEDELKKKSATYSKKRNWESYTVTDGLLITGQNHASSEAAAAELLRLIH